MNSKKHLIFQIVFFSIVIISAQLIPAIYIYQDTQLQSHILASIPNSYYINLNNEPISILYPRSAVPVIIEPLQEFIIQFKALPFDTLTASIETAYDPIPDTYLLAIENIHQEDEVYYATIQIPEDVHQELYNLTVTHESEGEIFSQTRPRSVSVKNDIDDTFTFIHIADFHIGDPRGLKENPKETIGWKAARKVIEEINLLNPDFVIITGDLTFGQAYPFEYSFEYKTCYKILQKFQVPTFLSPGNHDGYIQTGQDGLKFWERYFGPLYYSFNYGDNHFISINSYDWAKISRIGFSYLVFNWGGSVRDEQLQWIENDLQQHEQSEMISMMLHHNPIWDTTSDSLLKNGYQGREDLLSLIHQYRVNMVFAGHVHYDDVTKENETLFITTTTAASSVEDEDGYWGYRLVEINDGHIESINYKEPKYSIPSYKLNQDIINQYSLTIDNGLEQDIPFMKEFIVPQKDYAVNHGEIIQKREKENMAAIYVTGTINNNSKQTITLT